MPAGTGLNFSYRLAANELRLERTGTNSDLLGESLSADTKDPTRGICD